MKKSKKSKHGGKRPGAGRKPIGPSGAVPFSGSVPVELADAVDYKRGEKTRSEVLREALLAWVARK